MRCPKCEEGNLQKIQFKKDKAIAYVCDVCEQMWFVDEDITATTGHALGSYKAGEDFEYTIDNLEEPDQEHQPVVDNSERR